MPELNLYPVKFHPIYKEMIWGGTRIVEKFHRKSDLPNIGESWDISCRPQEMGVIANGPNSGLSFEEYINLDKENVLGKKLKNTTSFPLLIKIIDANDALSIQVHPNDEDAKKLGSTDTGKSEMWYILHPPNDGKLIIGLKPGITQESLEAAYKNGTVEDCLNRLEVKTGDIIDIPAGLIHALTPGVMVAEVQQNSDITYRLYDYNRLGLDGQPRPLHVKEALAVSDFEEKLPKTVVTGTAKTIGRNTITHVIKNRHFAVEKYEISEPIEENTNPDMFCIFICVSGRATIGIVEITSGESVFLPAGMGAYNISPSGKTAILLKSYVPN